MASQTAAVVGDGVLMSVPSTWILSRQTLTVVPASEAMWPLTHTRPAVIHASACRRDATPRRASTLCKRSSAPRLMSTAPSTAAAAFLSSPDDTASRCRRGRVDDDDGGRRPGAELRLLLLDMVVVCCWCGREEVRLDLEEELLPWRETVAERPCRMAVVTTRGRAGDGADRGGGRRRGRDTNFSLRVGVHDDDCGSGVEKTVHVVGCGDRSDNDGGSGKTKVRGRGCKAVCSGIMSCCIIVIIIR